MSVSALTHKTTEQFLPSLKEETLVDTATATVTVKLDGLSEFRELVERFEKALAQGGTIAGWPAWSVSVGPRVFNSGAAAPQYVDTIQVRDKDGDVWSLAEDEAGSALGYAPLVEVLPGETKFKVGDTVRITGPLTSHNSGDVGVFEAGQIVTVTGAVGEQYDGDIRIEGESRGGVLSGIVTQWIDPDSLSFVTDPRVWETFADVPEGVKVVDKDGDTLERTEFGDARVVEDGRTAPVYWADYSAPFTEVIEWSPATEVQVVVGGHEFKAGDRVKVTGPSKLRGQIWTTYLNEGETGTVVEALSSQGNVRVEGDVIGYGQWIDPASLTLITEPRVFQSVADIPEGVEAADKDGDRVKRLADGFYRTGGTELYEIEDPYKLDLYSPENTHYEPTAFAPFTEVLN